MRNRNRNRKRRGAALIIALVCIVILGFLLTSVLRFTLVRRKALTLQMKQAQATSLADSGLRLATAWLALDPDYAGETWEITPESLQGKHGATVTIEVKQSTDDENSRLVKVTADYPKDPAKRARVIKAITVRRSTE